MKLLTAKYDVYMKRFFYWLGLSIGRNPKRYIGALLLITLVSCLGFLRFHQINNARVTYTDRNSPSNKEGAMFFDFLRQNGTLHMIEVLIESNDGDNLLRDDYRQQLVNLTNEIIRNITVQDSNGDILSYDQLCKPYCEKNDAFYALINLFNNFDSNSTAFEFTYPTSQLLGRQIFIANNIFGVKTETDSDKVISFKTVILRYYLTNEKLKPMIDFEDKLVNLLYDSGKYPLLRAQAGSDNIVSKEVKRLGSSAAPYLSVSLVLLCIFQMICSLRYRRKECKPIEACLGAFIPVLSGITTIGMVAATGLAFQSIIVSTLFLILAIGIDDVFIMLAAWHRSDRSLDIPHRIAETVQEAGCSMTVTSVTNVVSFGNGVLSSTPVLQTFAIYSTVASVVCFVYQLVIFTAIIAIRADKEYEISDGKSQETFESLKNLTKNSDKMWKKFAAIVGTNWIRVLMMTLLLGYWYLSAFGVLTMQTDVSIQKMGDKESRIVKFRNELDRTLKEIQSVAVLVHNPGDLRNSTRLQDLFKIIEKFENAKYSFGKKSTISWVQQYLDFLQFYGESEEEEEEETIKNFTYTKIPNFLNSETYLKPTVRFNPEKCKLNQPTCIESFIFTTGFTTVVRYNDLFPVLQEWRKIAAAYPDFEIYPYTEKSNFADQTNDMVENIWQTVLSEVICMALTFCFFIPDIISIFAAVFSLLSVNMGVFGFLSLWGVGMDPVSTASLLMSIGFSVDICSHISYHYYSIDEKTPQRKLEHTFTHIGWPTIQGALSTMLAMMPIIFSTSYLGMVFLKTVILVCIFGLIHGLIVLPVFLSLFSDISDLISRKKVSNSPALKSKKYLPHRITIRSIGNEKF